MKKYGALVWIWVLPMMLWSQDRFPDLFAGRRLMPVWNKVDAPFDGRPFSRTYYLLPADSTGETKIESFYYLFYGVGRAYYNGRGKLLWVEEGYGVVTRSLPAKSYKIKKSQWAKDAESGASKTTINTEEGDDPESSQVNLTAYWENGILTKILLKQPNQAYRLLKWTDSPGKTPENQPAKVKPNASSR